MTGGYPATICFFGSRIESMMYCLSATTVVPSIRCTSLP